MPGKKFHNPEPDLGSLELTAQLIRERAYGYYEQRGREDGHDLEDWFRAEAEVLGKKASDSEVAPKRAASSAVAA